MFEASLISYLKYDTILRGYVSSYASSYAIFSDVAPENAVLPFAETQIQEITQGDSIVATFSILVDLYANSESGVNARKFCQRLIEILDRHEIDTDERYSNIRFFYQSITRLPENDPRDIHYSVQFSARAGRKKYIDTYTSIGE